MQRPVWAEVDLGAIAHNVRTVKDRLAPGAAIMAVVKANAYGHGDEQVARAAVAAGATWCGVILVDEGVRLRRAGIDVPILLLHEPPAERVDEAIANDLTPCVFSERGVETVASAATRVGRTVAVHLKVDTGLNRLGVPMPMVSDLLDRIAKEPRIELQGVFSHFAFADQPRNPVIDQQLSRFQDTLELLQARGVRPALRHLANSAASLSRPDTHFDLVRLGIAMYGLSPGPELDGVAPLRPAMSLHAKVAMVKRVRAGEAVSYGHRYRLERDGTIITLPLGYADGWARALSSNASIILDGARYPAVGTVCMDSFMADIGDASCAIGDEVVLIGSQGQATITADEVAASIDTINYEIVTRIGARVPRVYRGA